MKMIFPFKVKVAAFTWQPQNISCSLRCSTIPVTSAPEIFCWHLHGISQCRFRRGRSMCIESVRLDRDAYIICNDEGKLLPLPPNRLYGPTDFFAGPFLICGDGGEDLISLTDSQITKYEKKYHSPLIFLELYPKPITLKCTPELYAKCMGEEHQHDAQENERDER